MRLEKKLMKGIALGAIGISALVQTGCQNNDHIHIYKRGDCTHISLEGRNFDIDYAKDPSFLYKNK